MRRAHQKAHHERVVFPLTLSLSKGHPELAEGSSLFLPPSWYGNRCNRFMGFQLLIAGQDFRGEAHAAIEFGHILDRGIAEGNLLGRQ